jgi:predicted enzyme related to lactoylglutathione lyase
VTDELITIETFSLLTGLSITTLRHYDDIALVLDGDDVSARSVMERHRDALANRGTQLMELVGRLNDYIEGGLNVQAARDIRIVAINIGVPSEEALQRARNFWEAVLGVKLENWGGSSWQVLLGPDGAQARLNIRLRSADEPHHSHTSAFGLSVPDVQASAGRAIAAGGKEHYPPTDGADMPSHTLIEDPVGNRVVFWQA